MLSLLTRSIPFLLVSRKTQLLQQQKKLKSLAVQLVARNFPLPYSPPLFIDAVVYLRLDVYVI